MNKITNEQKWAVGLIESDGYIGFNITSEPKKQWGLVLKVSLHWYNRRALHRLKAILQVGKVRGPDKAGMVTYKLSERELFKAVICKLLDNYPFRGIKYHEYQIVKEAIKVMEDKEITKEERHERLQELKKQSKEKKNSITPVVSQTPEKTNEEQVAKMSIEKLLEIYDYWWIAGYIEGDGSFQINDRLQIVFELGQAHDTFAVYALHKILKITSKIKVRPDGSYTVLSTKHPKSIEELIKNLEGKMLGIKSFEFRVWKYAYRTTQPEKKQKAKNLLNKIRSRKSPQETSLSKE